MSTPPTHWTSRFLLAFALLGTLLHGVPAPGSEPVDFAKDVVPLLQKHCLACHNDQVRDGDFSLSRPSDLVDLGYVDTTDPDSSHLLELVTPIDGTAEMPKDGAPLSSGERAVLRSWIAAGAEWDASIRLEPAVAADLDWWSLRPIASPGIPSPGISANGAEHPVDSFLDRQLRQQGLIANAQAEPRVLIRRLTYDLTGLPPTPDQWKQFRRESRQDFDTAWRRLVDRLLATPAFGEKWGQHWLDVARYAETHGYDKDKPRPNAWPYRDYVIDSLNTDKPYAQFVREQVAGDALPNTAPQAIAALGFLAAGPWDFIGHQEVGEGKLDGRIAKHLDRDEMISAVFNVFQSTTIQCAQCHHHKFDPIRMQDYYRLHAVFAAVDRADRVYRGVSRQQRQEQAALESQINRLEQRQRAIADPIDRQIADQTSQIDHRIAELKEVFGATQQPQFGYHSQISQTAAAPKWVQIDLGQARNVREIRLVPAFDPFGGIGAGFGFPVRYRVQASNDAEFGDSVRTLVDATDRDQPNPLTRPVHVVNDGSPFRFVRVTATKLRERTDDYIFALGEIEVIGDDGSNLASRRNVTAKDSIESGPRWGRDNLVDGIFYRELTDDRAMAELRELQRQRVAIESDLRSPEVIEQLESIRAEIRDLRKQLQAFPPGDVVYAVATQFEPSGAFVPTEGAPREIHLLHRGDLRSPGDLMTPGAPPLWNTANERFFDSQDWQERDARKRLADYLVQKDNPLVWRSITNRLWQWTFGQPLVATPNDFGRGGERPTHPELLDYLSARLRDDPNQSLKSIVRLLVTSRAYRRSSEHQPASAAIDQQNTLLWRANRRRLTAEEFRDSLLAISGALDRRRGGPSFRDFVIEKPEHSPHYEYHLHDPRDPKSYRRTVYRFVVRSQPQPMLTTLDCADPSISVPRRDESTTALQALTTWNHRFVATMAERFAEHLRRTAPDSAADQVNLACRLAWGFPPDPMQRDVLLHHLQAYGLASFSRVLFNTNDFVFVD
ncbi:DUF1549 domain-containing protein [Roseiconus nitratireducens]|uniref:DUF1549 domain-containing protein n=1 Tax=Roseiconus nitratireducens TaxID=2605748 RepID=A0A5M6D1L5_9BACT|nr:DUF1553 domain-containing protein [Roseiconus nitratireducens]KAA5541407.1 DUF1549 domain-containing protein [Roseiconus nitratireducens]